MSASEQTEKSLEELVAITVDDEPKMYEDIVEEVSARKGGNVTPSRVTDILDEEYTAVVWRDAEEHLQLGYRDDDLT